MKDRSQEGVRYINMKDTLTFFKEEKKKKKRMTTTVSRIGGQGGV